MKATPVRTIITADEPTLREYLHQVWRYRSFVITLAKRDLKIKYAQTALGMAWSVFQPLTAVVVFSLFFTMLLNVDAGYPYALFVLSGVLCWNLFNYIFSHASTSIMNNQDLVRKLAFPNIVLPLSKVLVGSVEVLFTLVLMFPMLLWWNMPLRINMLALPFLLFFVAIFSLGLSLILAASTMRFRDLHHIIPFLVNFGIWFTPVFYPVSLIPKAYAHFIYLNPMASMIGMVRWSLFGDPLEPASVFGLLITIILFVVGVIYFKRVEDKIAELV
jgi:lipopolysaccharide transport system permease protein